MKIIKETDHLVFSETKDTGKTKLIYIYNKKNDWLGLISWYGAWRRYTFTPFAGTVYDVKCLNDITEVINELMEERKNVIKSN